MSVETLLDKAGKFELAALDKRKSLPGTHVPFTGSPRRHPVDADKVILVADPGSPCAFYYEFFTADVDFAEKLPSQVTGDGESVTLVRLWVRKGGIGLRCTPFLVEDTRSAHLPATD
jgi:inorganic pyrophosphatase